MATVLLAVLLVGGEALAQTETDPVWSATMTAGDTRVGHGYDATDTPDTPAIGALDDDDFDYGSLPYRVLAIDVAPNVVRFAVEPAGQLADETLTLELGGHALAFSDRISVISIGLNLYWLVPAALDDLETEFPVGSTATVCLRTATQVCPTGSIVTPPAAGVTVSVAALTVTEQDTAGDSYTVVLDTEPTHGVTVTVGGHSGTDVSLSASTLTFTTSNWDRAQTVTVTALNDDDTADDAVTLTHTATSTDGNYSGIAIAGVAVTVTDNDTTTPTVTLVLSDSSIGENGGVSTVTATVSPASAAAFTVTVAAAAVSPAVAADFRLSANRVLSFAENATTSTGSVTITGVDNDVDAADKTVTVSGTVSATSVTAPATRTLTLEDDDAAGVTVSAAALTVTEQDTAGDSYTVVLDTEPTHGVTVTVGGHSGTDVSLSASTLTFTTSNWDRAQTVTVTALNDDDTADDAVTLTHTATSTDGNYSGIAIAAVAVTVTDNDTTTPTVTLVLSDSSIGENGGVSTVTATVSPASAAAFTVTVAAAAVSPAVAADFRLSANRVLSFAENATTSTGSVTITGVDNDVDAADKTVTVSGTVSATSVTAPATRTLTLEDDDAAGVTVSAAALTVTEQDTAGDSYTVVLDTEPTHGVTVTVGGHSGTDVSLSASTLTFTTSNWDRAQTVTVTALNDDDTADDAVTLTHTATSTDGNYSGIAIAAVAVTVTDNDTTTPTVTLVLSDSSIGENGGVSTVTATVSPASAAAFTVTVAAAAVSPAVAADFRLSANRVLSFAENATTSTGSVTITGVDNDVDAADKTVTVSGTVSATSVTAPATRTLTLEDDDAAGVTVSAAALTVTEQDTAGDSYTVVLDTEPTHGVTVTVGGHAGTDVSLSASTLTFTTSNWDRAQTVTVTALNDDDTADDAVTLTHTATSTDGNYSGIAIAAVAVTVTDNDTTTPTVTLVLSDSSIGENGGVSTVTATVSPASAAAFTVTVAAAAVSPAVAADFRLSANRVLSFAENATTSTGSVTITGVDNDVDAADKTVTVSGTVSATSVTAPATRTLTLEDDDAANAPPSFISLAEFEVEENETAVGTVRAEDNDTGDAVTGYSIAGGADQGFFSIGATSGALTFDDAPNFEDAQDQGAGNTYEVTVQATSGTGAREKTATQAVTVTVTDDDTEAPAAPGAPTVSAASVTSLSVTWQAPDNDGPAITDYDYRHRTSSPPGAWVEVADTTITGLSATIGSLQENTSYDVQVQATNDEGTGGWSASGSGATDANAALGVEGELRLMARDGTEGVAELVTAGSVNADPENLDPPVDRVELAARVEIFHAGRWGTVCSDRIRHSTFSTFNHDANGELIMDSDGNPTETVNDNEAAALICQARGYDTGAYAPGFGQPGKQSQPLGPDGRLVYWPADSIYPHAEQPIWLDDLSCVANNASPPMPERLRLKPPLEQCNYAGWGLHNCTHKEDAGVRCWNNDTGGAGLKSLKGRFVSPPERHDGTNRVKVRVAFSEPVEESPENVGAHGVEVEGGEVTSVSPVGGDAPDGAGTRSAGGRNAGGEDREVVWEFEIEPDSDGDLTVTLEAGRPCGEPGAICTADGRALSEGISTTVEGPEAPPPLTASFENMPEAHDGAGAFRFRVAFSEPIAISFRSLREDAFAVTGGRVTRGKRVDGRKDLFEITVEPDGAGEVAISLPAGRECSVSGAICTWGPPRKQLTNTPTATVAGPAVETGPASLTASFVDVPAEHDGETAFKLRIAFSEPLSWMNGRRLREDVVAVSGGRATKAGRVNRRRDLWKLTVEPDSLADVTVTLAAGAACDSPAAVCTADGRALSNTISATVEGPVAVSVADARAREGEDETIDFAVSLSRAASGRVSVSYATADGTATAGSDYTRASGKLRFAPGETEKTISVPVLDDAHDEGAETFTLRLTASSGAAIADGVATGTIENTDHMPAAWLARFGRTVTDQVLGAVEARLLAPRAAGARATLAGQALPSWDAANDDATAAASDDVSERGLAARDRDAMTAIRDWMARAGTDGSGASGSGQAMPGAARVATTAPARGR